ncbi:MAG: V-type ATP synthase subunit I [Clostridia bacterium]|nr:V-type ATP synthase subunit I [Clostridia bacterium]
MSVSKMEKLTVILPHDEIDAVLRRLMRLGTVSLSREEAGECTAADLEPGAVAKAAAQVARIDAVLPLLTKRSRRKKPLFSTPVPFDPVEFKQSGDEEKAWKTIFEVEKVTERTAALKARLAEEEVLMQSLVPYLDFKFPLDDKGTKTAALLLGSLPAGIKQERIEALACEIGFVAEILSSDSRGVYLAVITHRQTEQDTLRALSALGFLKASIPQTNGHATALFDAAQSRANKIKSDMERLDARLDVLAENLTEVEILSDLAHTALLTEQNKEALLATKKCAVLTGWCPTRERERVSRVLDRAAAAYEFSPPAEGDDVPVLLQNNPYARNFEWVLGMYSYPRYGKFDPTFIMSIFYFLIFGLMFADAGYGLTLVIACFGAVRWLHPREGMKRFLLMFGYCGISCIIFGVIFGSYFGNFPLAFMQNVLGLAPEEMPNLALIPSLEANVAILFDPIQNPMGFLVVSLAFGALHLLAGMAVRAYVLCREGHPLTALFDIGSYWALFAGIGTVFFHRTVGIILIAVGVVAIVATQGRHKKGVAGKLIGGLGGLYSLINYASDLLSYSRILALGLAAGVIAQVVNILATMKGASFIGFLIMIVVFIIGHLLNLVINVLGTFVHTSRLQYIEFFGKFYEDGGTPFNPMKVSDKYATDVSEELENETAEPAAAPQAP